jgi:hypothetical protein
MSKKPTGKEMYGGLFAGSKLASALKTMNNNSKIRHTIARITVTNSTEGLSKYGVTLPIGGLVYNKADLVQGTIAEHSNSTLSRAITDADMLIENTQEMPPPVTMEGGGFFPNWFRKPSTETVQAQEQNMERRGAQLQNLGLDIKQLTNQGRVYFSKIGFIHKDNYKEYVDKGLLDALQNYHVFAQDASTKNLYNLFHVRLKDTHNIFFKYTEERNFLHGNISSYPFLPVPVLGVYTPDYVKIRCENVLRCLEEPVVKHKLYKMFDEFFKNRETRHVGTNTTVRSAPGVIGQFSRTESTGPLDERPSTAPNPSTASSELGGPYPPHDTFNNVRNNILFDPESFSASIRSEPYSDFGPGPVSEVPSKKGGRKTKPRAKKPPVKKPRAKKM